MALKVLKLLRIKLIAIAFSVLFLVSLYVLALRVASLFLEDYRPDLEAYLSSKSGQDITIHSLGSNWRGLDPTLNIHGLSINGRQQAYIGRIKIQLSFLDSLFSFKPSLKTIKIEHTELSLHQFEDGSWSFASVPIEFDTVFKSTNLDHQVATTFDLEALLAKTTIQLNDLSVSLHNNRGLVKSLRIPNSSVNYQNNNVYMSGSLRESGSANALASFSLEGLGVIGEQSMTTRVYIEARSAEFFGKLLKVYNWERLLVEDISASTRAWFEFSGLDLTAVQGDLQVIEMNWKVGEKNLSPIRNLAFDYMWSKGEEQNNDFIAINGFNFSWGGYSCSTDAIVIEVVDSGFDISVSDLNLFCASGLALASEILSQDLHARLAVSKPKGFLKNIKIETRPNSAHDKFSMEAELQQVQLEAYDGTPSGKGIDGYLYANELEGYVSFSSENFELGFPDLFLEPWLMEKTEGFVGWSIYEDNIDVYSDGLRLWQQSGGLVFGDFHLRLNGSKHEDYLDLALALQDLTATSAPSFVPYHIVGEDLHDWLVNSLQSGSVAKGIYLGHGSIESDDSENSFTSSIDLYSEQLALKFDPDWPPVEQLNANIYLQNAELHVNAPSAVIADSRLNEVNASMLEPEVSESSILRIDSSTRSDEKSLNYWLNDSPISEHTKAVAEQLAFKGMFDVEVSLDIPVSDGNDDAELSYLIRSNLENMEVVHSDSGIRFEQVNGVLDVSSSKGVTANDIQVIAFGESAVVDISTSFDKATYDYLMAEHDSNDFADLSQTNLSLTGSTDIPEVFSFLGYETTGLIEGEFMYQADLYLPNHQAAHPYVDIRSNLVGVDRKWPVPLDKKSDTKEDFFTRIKIKPKELTVLSRLGLYNGQQIDSELLFFDGKLSFGEVSLNGASMNEPSISGLNIAANAQYLDVSSWISFIDELSTLPWSNDDKHSSIVEKVQLDVGVAKALSYRFVDTHAVINKQEGLWNISLEGNDVKGQVSLPGGDSGAIITNFDYLSLNSFESHGNIHQGSSVDPRDFPSVFFKVNQLKFEGRDIGEWRADFLPSDSGAIISDISGALKDSNFTGRLNWQVLEEDVHNSILTLNAAGGNFENVFHLLGIVPLVSSDNFASRVALTWAGGPSEFDLGKVSGSVDVGLEDGFMNTDDEKTGVLRLFGVLNAEAILRRLKLDFTDLYKSGVGFDSLSLDASIDQGLLKLTEPMVVDGPAGKYVINGASDLASKSLDFDMLVELPFSQNVPLAALALGAPQIGGLVWLADKLLGEPLSALTTSRYDITGTWDKPVVVLKEAVNASKKDRGEDSTTQRITPSESADTDPDGSERKSGAISEVK